MKTFIAKQYLDSAYALRKEYISLLKKVVSRENAIKEHKDNLYKLVDTMNETLENITSEEQKKEYIVSKVVDIEKSIKEIQDEIMPYCNRIDEIRKEGDVLYNSIVEKYPNLTKAELEDQVVGYVMSIENNS